MILNHQVSEVQLDTEQGLLLTCPLCGHNTFRCYKKESIITINCLECNKQVGSINIKPEPQVENKTEIPG